MRWFESLLHLGIACLVVACGSAPSASRPIKPVDPSPDPTARRSYTIAVVGDSFTDPRSRGGGYVEYMKKRCPRSRIDNYGKGGDMVRGMRNRLLRDVLSEGRPSYTHVVVFGGAADVCNDLRAERTTRRIIEDLRGMYAAARAEGLQVVAITLPPWRGYWKAYNPRRAQAMQTINAWIKAQEDVDLVDQVVDTSAQFSCGRPEYLCERYSLDGMHFNEAGQARLGQFLVEQVFGDCR